MQNKGAIRLFAILLALVCVFQLTFTLFSNREEKKADKYALEKTAHITNEATRDSLMAIVRTQYIDSISNETVYNFLFGLRPYTYKDVKARELNLGLDLRGGMNVTLEISVVDLVRAMSNYSKDPKFNEALVNAEQAYKAGSNDGFITLFGRAYEELEPNGRLAAFFLTPEFKDLINFNSTNQEVLSVIRTESDAAIDNSFNILRSRIDRFGVAQPNIQKLSQRGRILVELPGVKDKERVRTLLQGTASLEFWETYENNEIFPYLAQANDAVREWLEGQKIETDSIAEEITEVEEVSDELSLLDELKSADDSTAIDENAGADASPLFNVLAPNLFSQDELGTGPVVGYAHVKDTARVRQYLNLPRVKAIIPQNVIFSWSQKPVSPNSPLHQLIALKSTTRDNRAPLDGSVITDARQDFGQNQASAEVNMNMNSEGAKIWARLTKENLGRSVAIVLDGYVVSFPTVQSEITGGSSNITGNFSVEEAKDLANMLKSGKMPAPAKIVEEYVVGPSLGQESINSGLWSFFIAFVLVLIYMIFMYSAHAGGVANVALLANLFFLIGVLASFGAVLTLPGIAGIVLTMGMAVDANVLIYERVQEEIKAGKGLRLAISDGYRNAYSAIIDGQVTTLLTGIVLFFFGSGPIKGFATTLIIGIMTSLFTSIFITRLSFESMLGKDKTIRFVSKFTANLLQNTKILFLEKRKVAYVISGILIVLSLTSIVTRGFQLGIDFKGGRTYVIEFKENVLVSDVSQKLAAEFGTAPEVKTFGSDRQVRITTNYQIDNDSPTIDNEIEAIIYKSLVPIIGSNVELTDFTENYIKSSTKVGPTISEDIKRDALLSILFALVVIFLYIMIRFKNWQYGLGGVASIAHDSILILGIFSAFSGIFPFSLEIDQAFIAAILTVLGYSINDTVIVFDRIREYIGLYPKRDLVENMDTAINNTLRRTFSTSLSTIAVLLAIFIFGGETIRGFTFALLVGVIVGTYSSIFVATPIAYDTQRRAAKIVAKYKKD